MPIDTLDIIDNFGKETFEGLVAKNVYMMLFPMVRSGNGIVADTSENLLNGYKLGGFTGSGDTADSEELQDQLMGNEYKVFVGGILDGGDFTINSMFNPDKPRLKIIPMRHSRIVSPQFVFLMATTSDDPEKLDVFLAAGVNYLGGRDIKGDFGKVIGTSFKFKVTGKSKVGTAECGQLDIAFYGPM